MLPCIFPARYRRNRIVEVMASITEAEKVGKYESIFICALLPCVIDLPSVLESL